MCKFGDYCKYLHSDKQKKEPLENLSSKIDILEEKIVERNQVIEELRFRLAKLENEVNNMKTKDEICNEVEFLVNTGDSSKVALENQNVSIESDILGNTSNIPQLEGGDTDSTQVKENIESESFMLPFGAPPNFIPGSQVWFPCDMCRSTCGSETTLIKHKEKKHRWKTTWV